jgi:hypothetical protein
MTRPPRPGSRAEHARVGTVTWITRNRVCRTCGSTDLTRYHRKGWMRLFRGSQLLRCRQCRSTILLLPGAVTARTDRGADQTEAGQT